MLTPDAPTTFSAYVSADTHTLFFGDWPAANWMAALMVLKGLARSPFAPVSLPLLAETNTHLAATPSVPSQFSSWYLSSKGSFGFDGVHDEPLEDPPLDELDDAPPSAPPLDPPPLELDPGSPEDDSSTVPPPPELAHAPASATSDTTPTTPTIEENKARIVFAS